MNCFSFRCIHEFIDDSGAHISGLAYLQGVLGSDQAPDTLASYAVRNLGFIWLCHRPSGVEIRLRPSVATGEALSELIYWLADHPRQKLMLATLEDQWRFSVGSNRERLLSTIMRWLDGARARTGPNFMSAPNPELRRRRQKSIEALRARAANCDSAAELVELCRTHLGNRFTLVSPDDHDRMLIAAIGGGYGFVDSRWERSAVGQAIDNCPDRYYGSWVNTTLRRVARTGSLSFESVDVMITHPTNGRRRFRYDRFVAALPRSGKPPLVLTSSVPNPGIDLRVVHI